MNHPINVSRRSTKALLLLPLLFSTATARPVQADTPIATIHQFGNPDPGVMAPPIRATDGNFYGTIEDGGGSNLYRTGRVYKMTPAGVYSILYPFSGLTDGGDLIGGIIQGRDGNLYGTTAFGGLFGNGTVYKLTLDGKLTTLHSFSGPDGINPAATLTQAADGYFYGTTNLGGSSNDGTVFRISTSGAFLTVHQFDGTNGSFPDSKLAVGRDGNLYGTTDIDGGVAPMFYSISPAGAFHVLNSNLWIKGGVIQGGDGNFYGVGPNALYSITPSGAATALTTYGGDWTLSAYIDGGDGNLYGTSSITTTTADGTTTDSYIDAISSTGVHYGFARSSNPVSSVVAATSTGWIVDEPTTLNSIDYASNDTAIGTKVLSADAANPSQIVQIADGTIWGISYNPWVYGATGSLFSMTSDGRSKFVRTYAYFSMPSNPSDTGYDPNPFNLLGIDGRGSLWGATSQSLAQIDPSGSVNYLPTDFLGCNKMIAGPNGDLYAAVGNYSASGAIVKIDANGTITTVHGFSGPDGAYPSSVLYASDGNFYGVTKQGGANNDGEVFKMTPQGDVTVVYSFTSAIFPSELIEGHDGRLYGISRNGGDVYEVTLVGQQLTGGTAFAITKTGGGFTTLHAFGIPDGIVPVGTVPGAGAQAVQGPAPARWIQRTPSSSRPSRTSEHPRYPCASRSVPSTCRARM